MDEDSILQAAHKEVLQKIGRNLLSFQTAELILKELIRLGGLAMRSSSKPAESFEAMTKRVQTMTLGGLTSLFTNSHCTNKEPTFSEAADSSSELQVSLSYSFRYSEKALNERRESLATLVKERNELVHHLLPEFDRDSLESCAATAAKLDRQRELVLPEIKRLQQDCRFIQQEFSNLAELFLSSESRTLLAASRLRNQPLIKAFLDFAQTHSTPDKWVSLNLAASSITGFTRAKINEICTSFGYKSLTELMIDSQMFEIHLEPTGENRHRVLYRHKHHNSLLLLQPPQAAA